MTACLLHCLVNEGLCFAQSPALEGALYVFVLHSLLFVAFASVGPSSFVLNEGSYFLHHLNLMPPSLVSDSQVDIVQLDALLDAGEQLDVPCLAEALLWKVYDATTLLPLLLFILLPTLFSQGIPNKFALLLAFVEVPHVGDETGRSS